MPEIRGTMEVYKDDAIFINRQGEDNVPLADVLLPLQGQPVRVLHQSGHGGREWVVIERVVEG